MLEDQDQAVPEESGAPASTKATTPALRRVRAWRNEPNVQAAEQADLSAALKFVPENEHSDAERIIRGALRYYLGVAHLEERPGPDVLARALRTLETTARATRRALLARPNAPTGAVVPDAIAEELCARGPIATRMRREDLAHLSVLLVEVRKAAEAAAARAKAAAGATPPPGRTGRPSDNRAVLLLKELKPLWGRMDGGQREAFVQACLATIGERLSKEAIRKRIERADIS
jgi:hypothetical protein